MENKYLNGKIYKIISPSHPELVYYGSTIQKYLEYRMNTHRKNFQDNKNISSKEILQYDDAKILLVENYPCNNKEELNKKEGEYIRNNECVNKLIAGGMTQEEKKERKKEIDKKYRENHQQIIKKYKEDHKLDTKEYNKKYYQKNKNII